LSGNHISVFWSDEDGGYIAEIHDLDGCSAFGAMVEQAVAEVSLAKEAWLEAARGAGRSAPEPPSGAAPGPAGS
jgi:predicted RNase H-like HicB family nuclease